MAKKFNSRKKIKKSRQSTYAVTTDVELLAFLLANVKDKSRNKIKAMLTHKQFKVGKDIITQYNHLLKKGIHGAHMSLSFAYFSENLWSIFFQQRGGDSPVAVN